MKTIHQMLVLLTLTNTAAFAQSPPPPLDYPMSTWLREAYTRNRANIVPTAQRMPERDWDMRPDTQQEVRTFGQQVVHVANFNFLWRSQAKGEKNPNTSIPGIRTGGRAEEVAE